jgi:hypothetical protein
MNSVMNRNRVFLLATLFAAVVLVPAAEPAWFRRSLVGLEVGPTGSQFGGSTNDTGFATRFNGRDIARAAKASGAEYLVVWTREGEWAFYDSKLQPKPPGLGARDVLREAVDEGVKLGLPIIAYCQVQYPAHALRQHPDWRMVDKDGRPIDGRVCYRSGYVEYMKRMVGEQLAYGVDGFHLDMVDQGFGPPHGCWCATCRTEFEAQHGRPMPKGVTWDEDWDRMLAFRYASSERFEKVLAARIRQINPRATVDYNYHGNPPFSWEVGQRPVQHAGNGDFVTGETGVWGFSALTVGLNAEFYKAATPGLPFQIAMQRGVRMYHDQTTRPLHDLRWELFTLLSHGGFVTIVDNQDWPMSADAPVGPAILLNRLGQGSVLTFAASPDWATASDHHLTETRKLLANAVGLLNPTPRITIEAPVTVQAVVTDDPGTRTLRVHLLGYNAPPQTTPAKDRPYVLPVPIEDAPTYRVSIITRERLRSAKALNPSTELKHRGKRVDALVNDIHEVLQLRY